MRIESNDQTVSVTIAVGRAGNAETCEVDDHAIDAGALTFTDDSDVKVCAEHMLAQMETIDSQ